MKAKASRGKDFVQFSVPSDSPLFLQCTENAEIFHLRDGHFLISFGGIAGQKTDEAKTAADALAAQANAHILQQSGAAGTAPTEEEISALKKLSAIRFENRIPSEVDKSFSPAEKKALSSLLKKKLVTLFISAKYKSGVYNISSSVYPHMSAKGASAQPAQGQHGEKTGQNAPGTGTAHASGAHAPTSPASINPHAVYPLSSINHLEQKGYMIVESEGEAKFAASRLEPALKSGDVIGVRGFDRKFYVAKKQFYLSHEAQLRAALAKKPMAYADAAAACNVEPAAAQVLLVLLSDRGEIIEKSKGTYANA